MIWYPPINTKGPGAKKRAEVKYILNGIADKARYRLSELVPAVCASVCADACVLAEKCAESHKSALMLRRAVAVLILASLGAPPDTRAG